MMSDRGTESDGSEQDTEVVYRCKKCPGVELRTEAERNEHREVHRGERANAVGRRKSLRTAKPGPASKKHLLRNASPTPSSGTLFTEQRNTRLPQVQVRDMDVTAPARKTRAIREHLKTTGVYNRKNTGG